jgi:hypothetical protein
MQALAALGSYLVCLSGYYDTLALNRQENSSGYSVAADWKCLDVWCKLITADIPSHGVDPLTS